MTVNEYVRSRESDLPDIFKAGTFEVWLDTSALYDAVTQQLEERWDGDGEPPEKWLHDNFDEAARCAYGHMWLPEI
ncbi:MAG: hypothetical protein AB7O98_17520 [Hyphomonadaceae bacterium]